MPTEGFERTLYDQKVHGLYFFDSILGLKCSKFFSLSKNISFVKNCQVEANSGAR